MDNYEILGQIGKGSFGLVQKVKRKSDGKVLVWKEMNYGRMSEREKQQLVAEVNIIRELKHPNIVRYYDRIIEKKETKIFIIMEFCEGGDVGTLLKKCKKEKDYIAEDVIWKIFTQIILALNECHNRPQGKILHRDLKPANIFLDAQNNIKLGDFGLSRVMGEQSEFADTHVGTPYYMSPEQIQEKKYNEKSDIWSAGCLLYEMAALKPPFEATNHLSLAIKIKSGKFERLPLRYSEELQKLIESMVHIDPEKRPSVQNILELPQISLRLKERKLRDKHSQIKIKEDELKKRGEQLQERIDQIEKQEKDLTVQEQALKDLEEQVKQLEAQLNIRSSQNSLQQSEEDIFQRQDKLANNNNAGILPQKSARGEYQLLSQNLNSFGKDLMMLNKGSVENNSSGSSSKNSTATASNNTFELFKKEKENMINNSSNIQGNLQSIENYRKEKEIQKQLQSYSSNKYPIFQKSNSSIISQSLTDQQMLLQQQNSQDTTSSQVVQQQSSENNQSNLQLRNNIVEAQQTQSSCSSNSSNNEANTTSAKEKNYTLYQRREQEAFQKTPSNNNNNSNLQQNYHTMNRQGEIESVTKKNTSYSKDHQYKSVDHFTSIQNNNNSSSKKDESTAFSTTCKQIPQSASQNQNIANQSSNKSSHKSSSENLPKKSAVASNSTATNSNQNDNQNQENTSAASNNIINNSNTGISAFERYKASILQQQQQQQQNQYNNGYLNKHAQIKSKVRQASQDSMDDNEQQITNNNYISKLHTQQPVSSKLRAQTSIDSVSVKQNQDNKSYLLNYKKDATSGSTTSAATITRRSANTTIDSVKYSQINNSSNMQGVNNNQNTSYEIYKQANIKRTDSYKENTFKNIMQQNSNINKQQEAATPSSSNNNQQTHSSTTLAQNQKNFQKNRSSLEPKNRFHSQHSTTSSSTATAQIATQQSQQSTSQVALNSNKPPITMMNNNGALNGNGNNNEDASLNFKTLPNTEFQYDSNNVNKMQIKKKSNNSFTTTASQNISNTYLNSNNNYINNQPRSTTNSSTIGSNSARINNTEQSIERKKEFPRPRNNYLLPSSKQILNSNQNQDANIKNYFSEQPNNLMTVQTEQLYNKYNLRKIGDNIISPSVQHVSSNQYRTATQY